MWTDMTDEDREICKRGDVAGDRNICDLMRADDAIDAKLMKWEALSPAASVRDRHYGRAFGTYPNY